MGQIIPQPPLMSWEPPKGAPVAPSVPPAYPAEPPDAPYETKASQFVSHRANHLNAIASLQRAEDYKESCEVQAAQSRQEFEEVCRGLFIAHHGKRPAPVDVPVLRSQESKSDDKADYRKSFEAEKKRLTEAAIKAEADGREWDARLALWTEAIKTWVLL